MRLVLTMLLCLACLSVGSTAFAQLAPPSSDPYVLLDEAKLKLADGKLSSAREMLASIDASRAEPYVQEELVFQRLLIDYSFLAAVGNLIQRMEETGRSETEYAVWLRGEWLRYAQMFSASAEEFLSQTSERQDLEFVRFRLPTVTEQNIQDLELFADEMVLTAAIENWAEGRGGLGRALVISQARVALVLAAAVHYDMAEASKTIREMQDRLNAGVLIYDLNLLDWLSRSILGLRPGWRLLELQRTADERIMARTEGRASSEWRRRAQQRLNDATAADDESLAAPSNAAPPGASE